jgi:hypothetical protein
MYRNRVMKLKTVLEDIDFGSDFAEDDDLLQTCFVETASFQDLIAARVDVILGPKGSGKSAMFRRLAGLGDSALRDVDVIAAFNVQGSPIFQRLARADPRPTEADLRVAWWWYVLALVGNHLLVKYPRLARGTSLRPTLESVGLLAPEGRPESVWTKLMSRLPSVRRIVLTPGVAADGTFTISAQVAIDDGAKGSPIDTTALDLEPLLRLESEILTTANRACWLLFDRLDESFTDDRELERRALRALLRMHLDLSSYGLALRTKLFLRTDVIARITKKEGFTNATHLRDRHIAWDKDSIRELVARRALESERFRSVFHLDVDTERWLVLRRLVPYSAYRRRAAYVGFGWVIQRVTDGSDDLNPRNVLTLLRIARSRQLDDCQRDDPDLDPADGHVLGASVLDVAWREVSQRRLTDTLYAEANDLRPWIERFSHRRSPLDTDYLSDTLNLKPTSEEFTHVVNDLVDAGFLGRTGQSQYKVGELYWPALAIVPMVRSEIRPKPQKKKKAK